MALVWVEENLAVSEGEGRLEFALFHHKCLFIRSLSCACLFFLEIMKYCITDNLITTIT